MFSFLDRLSKGTGLFVSPYDKRDYKFSDLVPVEAVNIPSEYSTPNIPDFRYDQGSTSMCCSCAYNMIRFMQEQDKDQSKIPVKFSVVFNYGNRIDGEETMEGMYLRSCLKKGLEGSIPFEMLPGYFSTRKCVDLVNKNKDMYLELAHPFRINSYYQCTSRTQIQQAIIETKAVLAGIYVYDSFYKPDKDGNVNYSPFKNFKNHGGHAVVIFGWKTDSKGKLWWHVINSWGNEYGINGTCWVPENNPFVESPWAIVDDVTETKWNEYKLKMLK